MDHFEAIIKTLLEHEGFWVRQSYKVNVTKQEKRDIGKHSIPRPEIDLLAFKQNENHVYAIEAKSYLDSPGVKFADLKEEYDVPAGRYKLFTCKNYRSIVLRRLKSDLVETNMADAETTISLGLVAGNVYQNRNDDIRELFDAQGWLFWSPENVRDKVNALAEKGYENEPAIITAKILMR